MLKFSKVEEQNRELLRQKKKNEVGWAGVKQRVQEKNFSIFKISPLSRNEGGIPRGVDEGMAAQFGNLPP